MQINIISIGKFATDEATAQLFSRYQQRTKFAEVKLIEVVCKNATTTTQQLELEGKLLLSHVHEHAKVIVLDERGKSLSTTDFCQVLNSYMLEAVKTVDIIIGGSDGLSNLVKQRADLLLSLSKMVFPHLLVRVIVMEQLYRVHTLLNHHPYHK